MCIDLKDALPTLSQKDAESFLRKDWNIFKELFWDLPTQSKHITNFTFFLPPPLPAPLSNYNPECAPKV